MNIIGLFKGGAILVSKHKSAILAGTAIVSAIGTTAFTIKGTAKAVKRIDEMRAATPVMKDEDNNDVPVKLDKVDVVKETWKFYIPAAIGLASTITCIVCAHKVDAKRIATVTSALLLSEKMNKELEKGISKENGVEKLAEIKDKIFGKDDKLKEQYGSGKNRAVQTAMIQSEYPIFHDARCWFKDEISGRVFEASRNQIEKSILDATREAINGSGIVSLNVWYDYLGLDGIWIGDMLGWELSNQTFEIGQYDPDIMDNGQPGLILRFMDHPRMI